MTLSTEQVPRNDYTATGGETSFAYTFKILDQTHLNVYIDGVLKTITTHYTVSGVGADAGGNITLVDPSSATAGQNWAIVRDVPVTQGTDYPERGSFPALAHEDGLDKLTMVAQDLKETQDRTLKFPVSESVTPSDLSTQADRKGKLLGFNSSTGDVEMVTPTEDNTVTVTSTGSTTTRTLANRFADIKNVLDYGATGDGVTDDTAAIQAAHDALHANGGIVFFPQGTYVVTSSINISKEAIMTGAGRNASIVSTNQATGDVFNCTAAYVHIEHLRFTSSVTRTADNFVHFKGSFSTIRDFYMEKAWVGIEISAGALSKIQDGDIRDGATGAGSGGIKLTGGNDHFIQDIYMDAPGGSQPSFGINLTDLGSVQIINADIVHHTDDLLINPGNGETVSSVRALNSYFDTAVRGIHINPTGTGVVEECRFTNCWTATHTGRGVFINNPGSGACNNIEFHSHESKSNTSNGLEVAAGTTNLKIIGGTFQDNSNGIVIAAGQSEFQIIGAKCGGPSGNSSWGIFIGSGASNNYVITGCDVRGNTTGGITDGGTGTTKYVVGNIGASSAGISSHLTGSTTWDPASLTDGSTANTTVTVTGASVGDTVAVGLSTLTTAGFQITGTVTATNTVTVTLTNHSGGTIDVGSGTLTADVWKH